MEEPREKGYRYFLRCRSARAIPCIHRITLRETAKPAKMIQYLSKVLCQHFLDWFVGETFKNLNTFFCKETHFINVLSPPKFGIPPVYAVYRRIRHYSALCEPLQEQYWICIPELERKRRDERILRSTAVGQVVACAPVKQRARIRSPVGISFLYQVFSEFFLNCKTNVRKL